MRRRLVAFAWLSSIPNWKKVAFPLEAGDVRRYRSRGRPGRIAVVRGAPIMQQRRNLVSSLMRRCAITVLLVGSLVLPGCCKDKCRKYWADVEVDRASA